MSSLHTYSTDEEKTAAIGAATEAIRAGECIVLPTDTVYGIGADAFLPRAVRSLLAAKRRGRSMPPPVLVGSVDAAQALVLDVPEVASTLMEKFWPGALTLILRENSSLSWDLGETQGTVAVRMPDLEFTRELLVNTGPLAVSSANISGQEPGKTAEAVREQLGDTVSVYIEGGPARGGTSSTIVDLTRDAPHILRSGAITAEQLREVVEIAE